MADEIKSLEGLKDAVAGAEAAAAAPTADDAPEVDAGLANNEAAPVYEQKRDELGRSYATGKRKDAIARVWVKPGTGKITVNGREVEKYFARPVLRMVINQPFTVAGVAGEFDVMCTVNDPAMRPALKKAGFITRDPRVVERKKYGKAKARRSFQFSKR